MLLQNSAVMPSGSLVAGVPAAQYPAGSYAFRTSILVLALTPVVDNAAFVQSLADWTSRTISARLRSGSISVGSPFLQEVPREATQSFLNIIVLSTTPAWSYPAVIPFAIAAAEVGFVIGSALNSLIPDRVPARWVTVDGIIDSPREVLTSAVTQIVASSLDTALRLRSPGAPYAIVQPRDAQVGASVVARTREDGACSGHRRLEKVIAAACTRLEATAPQPAAQQPAAQQPAAQQPAAQQPAANTPAAPSVDQVAAARELSAFVTSAAPGTLVSAARRAVFSQTVSTLQGRMGGGITADGLYGAESRRRIEVLIGGTAPSARGPAGAAVAVVTAADTAAQTTRTTADAGILGGGGNTAQMSTGTIAAIGFGVIAVSIAFAYATGSLSGSAGAVAAMPQPSPRRRGSP